MYFCGFGDDGGDGKYWWCVVLEIGKIRCFCDCCVVGWLVGPPLILSVVGGWLVGVRDKLTLCCRFCELYTYRTD